MEDYPQVDPEEMKRLDEKREKKLVRTRKNRLGHIQRHLMKMLKEISPEDFEKFEITYEPMTKYSGKGPAPSFRSSGYVSREHSPAYQFVLTQKDNPENRYKLMHLLKQDVDRNVRIADIPQHYQLLGFGKRKIPEGIEELRKKNEGGLESMPGIASIILISGSLFFLSSNFTGYTIANLSKTYFNLIGVSFFIAGLIVAFFYFSGKSN